MSRTTSWQLGILIGVAVLAILFDLVVVLGPRLRGATHHRPADIGPIAREVGREVVRRALPAPPFLDRRPRAGPTEPPPSGTK